MAAQNGRVEIAQLLVERGADPTIRDDLYGGDAAGAANYFGQVAVRDWLRTLGK
jgi:ankyrin repeat protein